MKNSIIAKACAQISIENTIIDERGVKTCIENMIIHERGKKKQKKYRESFSGQQSMIQQRTEKYDTTAGRKVQGATFQTFPPPKVQNNFTRFVAHNVLTTTPGRETE